MRLQLNIVKVAPSWDVDIQTEYQQASIWTGKTDQTVDACRIEEKKLPDILRARTLFNIKIKHIPGHQHKIGQLCTGLLQPEMRHQF